jgi:coenzyme F420-reducing hydrogenase delta subunit
VEYTRNLLEAIGIEGQRLQMINVSAAMAGEFAFAAAEIAAEIQRLGPNRLRTNTLKAAQEINTSPAKDIIKTKDD